MSKVPVKKAETEDKGKLPVFAELAQRFAGIRQRAFELFQKRGAAEGHELDDWLEAEREILGLPAAEVKDAGAAYEVEVKLPGFEAKEVDVIATADELVVHAKAEHEKTEKDKVIRTEYSEVYRNVPLPGAAEIAKVTAKLDKGVLRIKAPKAAAAKKKAVPVAA